MSQGVFNRVSGIRPGKSVFDLSYDKKFTADMGQILPVVCDEMVPGDIFTIGSDVVLRMQPLVAPIMHEINVTIHYFFVPYRILWKDDDPVTGDWAEFITGGEDGTNTDTLPYWTPGSTAVGSLWDYFGFPTGVTPTVRKPLAFPLYAYNHIYNEYYRDENLVTAVAVTDENIKKRAWTKDYFTSALPWLQKGTPPALPILGTTSAEWPAAVTANQATLHYNNSAFVPYNAAAKSFMDNNTVDLSGNTFDIAELRLAFQIQRWMERNARAGSRHVEYLLAHYGVTIPDATLQRPHYIGGSKNPVIVSEVLQHSETATTPLGELGGHGITANSSYVGKYRAREFGLVMGLMSIMPKPVYQQGINRQWLRQTRYDFYTPEFANLSEQGVENAEIYLQGAAADTTVFGYQGRFDEMRTKQSMVCGQMRSTFDYWHISRQFSSLPTLGQTFIECDPRKDIFAAPSEPGFIVHVGNRIKGVRPMPVAATPGLIDRM